MASNDSSTEAPCRRSFDICGNEDAVIHDLRYHRIYEYLRRTGSPLAEMAYAMPYEELCREMGMVSGPDGNLKPSNAGVLFFTERPEEFLPGACIDVVYKPVPSGDGMEEYHVTGPLDVQIENAISIASRLIGQLWGMRAGPDAKAVASYPLVAVRELLVNAVYHKSYQIPEPVRITLTPSSIEFLTYPGPDASISDEEIRRNQLTVGACRNIRIGECLKALGYAKRCNTGIPKAVKSLSDNGSPPLEIKTDSRRTYFKAVLRVHPGFIRKSMEAERIPIEDRIMALLDAHGRMRMLDISTGLGFKGINSTVRSAIAKLMSEGKVEYLYPDAPRSPKQRICLTSDKKP